VSTDEEYRVDRIAEFDRQMKRFVKKKKFEDEDVAESHF